MDKPPIIELLYFNECPSWKRAFENFQIALEITGITEEIKLINVETQAQAIENKFTGSPMLRMDGKELFPTGQNNYALGCRVFETPEGYKGWPTVEMISEKIRIIISS